MPLEKAYIEVLQGSAAGQRIPVLFNPADIQPRARQRLQVDRRARARQPADPVRQRRRGNAVDGPVPRRLIPTPTAPPTAACRHRPRREQERQGPHRRDHGAARHRPRSCTRRRRCASSGGRCASMRCWRRSGARSPCSGPTARRRARPFRSAFREYRPRRAQRRRSAPRIGRQDQAPPDQRRRSRSG